MQEYLNLSHGSREYATMTKGLMSRRKFNIHTYALLGDVHIKPSDLEEFHQKISIIKMLYRFSILFSVMCRHVECHLSLSIQEEHSINILLYLFAFLCAIMADIYYINGQVKVVLF